MSVFHHSNQKKWRGLHMLGVMLLIASVILLAVATLGTQDTDQLTLIALLSVSISLGLLGISTFTGVLIDLDELKIKRYQSILWMKFGAWKNLAPIDKVDMFIHTYKKRNFNNAISPTLSHQETVYKVVLLSESAVVLDLDFLAQEKASAALERLKSSLANG